MPVGDMSLDDTANDDMSLDGDNENTPTAGTADIDDDAAMASSEQQEQ